MKNALTLLIAGSAMGLASAAFAGTAPAGAHAFVFEGPAAGTDMQVLRVSGDDDDEEGDDNGGWFGTASDDDGEDDDEDEGGDCDDEEEGDEGGCAAGGAGNAAPAGTTAPPKNGLFTNGTAPQVKSN